MSVVAPFPQLGITRVMRERAVSRRPLIAWVALGAGFRVRRVRRACLCLVACARDGRNCLAASPSPRNGSLIFETRIHVPLDPLPGTEGLLGELDPLGTHGLEVISGLTVSR